MSEPHDTKDEGPAGLLLDDVVRALREGDPDAPALVARFLDQADPELKDPPPGTMRTRDLLSQLKAARGKRTKKQRIQASTKVWRKFLTQNAPLPPRFALADVIVDLYDTGGVAGRATVQRLM